MDGTLFRAGNRILRMLEGSLIAGKRETTLARLNALVKRRAVDAASYEHRPMREPHPILRAQRPPHFQSGLGRLKHGQACREG
jgi:hypothetical protein